MQAAYERTTRGSGTPGRLAPSHLVGGIGGLLFAATVVVQNILRSSAPADDAGAGKVAAFYSDHRSTTAVLAALFVVGAIGIALFSGGMLARLARGGTRGAAIGGAVGIAGVVALFSVTVATDLALSAYVHRGAPDPHVVDGLWVLHGALFGLLTVFIGIALAALAAAAAADGLVAGAWKSVGLLGGVLLAVTGAATPSVLDGSRVMVVGVVGFLTWLVFVVVASVALLRRGDTDQTTQLPPNS